MASKRPKGIAINRAPAVVHKWEKVLAFGCSHGIHADQHALNALVAFRERWKPDRCVHLGDFFDTAAFRSNVRDSHDSEQEVAPDIDNGLDFLERMQCTDILCGNHEARLYRELNSSNAIVRHCASICVAALDDAAAKLKASLSPYNGVWQGITIGGVRYMHGVMYGENATRDHAEAFGNVVHAHTHRTGMAKARRSDNATGWCVGTLAEPRSLSYADTRRATLAWSKGFVWGEFTDTHSMLWLHEQPREMQWRFPL